MNRTISSRHNSRASIGAIIVFGLVYAGALAITFAPKGSLSDASSMPAAAAADGAVVAEINQ